MSKLDPEQVEHNKSNREKRMSPRKNSAHWCDGCDANLIHDGETCSRCGYKSGPEILKKETNAR